MNEKNDADVKKSPETSKNTPETPKEKADTNSKPKSYLDKRYIIIGAILLFTFALIIFALHSGHSIESLEILGGLFGIKFNAPAPTPIPTLTPIPTVPIAPGNSRTPTPTPTVTPSPSVIPPLGPIIWQKSDLGFTFVEQQHLVIGPGRNEGFNRIYSGDGGCCDGRIFEFSFINNQWEKINIVGDNSDVSTIYGLEMGDVRNDGVNRVYASGYNIAEYYYASDSWLGGEVGPYIQWTNDLVFGDARNDGYVRMYVAEWNGINEISYNYGDWDAMEIDTGGQRVEKSLVTDGRNDGTLRLYAAVNGHVYEYSWSGSTWQVTDCGAIGGPYILNCDICAGDGRNDGKNRIYLASGGLYELIYDGGKWDYILITNADDIGAVTISNGRNDGVNRLYTGGSKGVGEYTYSGGSWAKTSLIEKSYKVTGLAVGDGRNDGINRIYATGDDNHIYEYSIG
jgi:hypothetical protein